MNNPWEQQPGNPSVNQYPIATHQYSYSMPRHNAGQPVFMAPQPTAVTFLIPYNSYHQDPNCLMQQHIQQQHSSLQEQIALKDQAFLLATQEIQMLKDALNVHRAKEMRLGQDNQTLKEEKGFLLQENIALKQQMTETQPVSYNEDTNQLSLLTSSISTIQNRPGVFEYQVLTLPSRASADLNTPLDLPALRFRLEDEANSSEYVQQFVPFIMEEIRASIAGQLEKIKMQQLRPFNAVFDPTKTLRAGEYAYNIICHTEEFPKLEHEFQHEVVFVVIKKTRSPAHDNIAKKWDTTEPLQGFLAIATSMPSRHNPTNSTDKKEKECVFSLLLLNDQYEQNTQYWHCKENTLEMHWLHGLIRASREYEACINPSKMSLESQIIRGNLPSWPAIEHKNTLLNTSPYTSQNEAIDSLEKVQSGLYCLQGPPGTGKTTTIVNLQAKWVNQYPNERILLCAPSNAAVQVVFTRTERQLPHVCMVIFGNAKTILDKKSDAYVNNYALNLYSPLYELLELQDSSPEELKASLLLEYERIFQKLHELNQHERKAFVKVPVQHKTQALEAHFATEKSALSDKDIFLEIANLHANIQRSIDILKDNAHYLEYFLVQRAQIVFATLTGSGRDFLRKQIPHFERLIIDEASQTVIPTTLIPLMRFNPSVCILVGDSKQLPATLISKNAQQNGYDTSLLSYFTEMTQKDHNSYPYKMLTIQFRMHQEICLWPSRQYYADALETDSSVFDRVSLFSPHKKSIFGLPALFFNIPGKEARQGHSFINQREAEAIVATTIHLLQCGLQSAQIGIITFYAAQASTILQELKYRLKKIPSELTVSTVDSFQGSERDIIMISAVRTKKDTGFLADSHRINVSMTRAKHNLYLFANANMIHQSNNDLANYAQHAPQIQEKDLIAEINLSPRARVK